MSRRLERVVAPESLNAFTSVLGPVPSGHKFEITDLSWNRQTGPQKQCVAAIHNAALGAVFVDDQTLTVTDYCKPRTFNGIVLYAGDDFWVAMLGASAGFCPVVICYVDVDFT